MKRTRSSKRARSTLELQFELRNYRWRDKVAGMSPYTAAPMMERKQAQEELSVLFEQIDVWLKNHSIDNNSSCEYTWCSREGVALRKEKHQQQLHLHDEIREGSLEEVQGRVEMADRELPEKLKEEYSARSFEDIKREFPNQWVAVLPTKIGGGFEIVEARPVLHADDWDTLDTRVKTWKERYPGVIPARKFTGELKGPAGAEIVRRQLYRAWFRNQSTD